jgi:biopolymer transport protein ExbD
MKCLLSVCFVAFTLIVVAARTGFLTSAQTLQKGISVVMAKTQNATPMPEADNADAWIVAVTPSGDLYFGTDEVTASSLVDEMKKRPRNRQAKLYIKADARAPFASVEKVLDAAQRVWFETAVLLTAQAQQPAPGTMLPPQGLEVLIGPQSSDGAAVVQVVDSGQATPRVKVNNLEVAPDALPNTLRELLQSQSERLIVVKAAGQVAFAPVAHVIDVAHATGVKVAVAVPE